MGRHEDAVTDLTRAIGLDPELAWAIAERGETYRLMGRYEEAVTDLTWAIGLDPDLMWATGTRGQAYRAMGRYEDALADFTRLIDTRPDNAAAACQPGLPPPGTVPASGNASREPGKKGTRRLRTAIPAAQNR